MLVARGAAVAALLLTTMFLGPVAPADARKRAPIPPPCPLTATLRIADPASLAAIRSLDGCDDAQIVVAPADPSEYLPPSDLRVAPQAPPAYRNLAAAQAGDGGVARIAPAQPEPDMLDAVASSSATPVAPAINPVGFGAEAVLTMQPMSYRTQHDAMIARVAQRHRVDPLLLHAVIKQESRYREGATSRAGARGLMQLMPGTARMLGIPGQSIAHAESNVDGGARLLRKLYARYRDFPLTLAAYNAGEGAVKKYGNRIPPYAETQNYVRVVMANYRQLVAEQRLAGR